MFVESLDYEWEVAVEEADIYSTLDCLGVEFETTLPSSREYRSCSSSIIPVPNRFSISFSIIVTNARLQDTPTGLTTEAVTKWRSCLIPWHVYRHVEAIMAWVDFTWISFFCGSRRFGVWGLRKRQKKLFKDFHVEKGEERNVEPPKWTKTHFCCNSWWQKRKHKTLDRRAYCCRIQINHCRRISISLLENGDKILFYKSFSFVTVSV